MFLNYPPGAFSSHWFQFFNALSYQVMMGAPIVLFAKSLGASSTVLGIITGFMPLMNMLQLLGAKRLERHGYRKFVLMGWGARSFIIFIVAAIPLMSFLEKDTKLFVLVAALFIYHCLRGITAAGWLPWMTALIPEEVRGRFLSFDQIFQYVGSLISIGIAGWLMHGRLESLEYTLLFLMSALNAVISLLFIQRIPDIEKTETFKKSAVPVLWRSMLQYKPFYHLIVFNLLYAFVFGGMSTFTIEYLRLYTKFDVSLILYLSSAAFVGSLFWLSVSVSIIDHLSTRVVFSMTIGIFSVVILGWLLLSARIIPCSVALVALLNFFSGLASGAFNIANARTSMSLIPEMGRNHFCALFLVITNLGLGIAPILWGFFLDMIGKFETTTGVFYWSRHSIYFLALFFFNLIAFCYISQLKEQQKNLEHV